MTPGSPPRWPSARRTADPVSGPEPRGTGAGAVDGPAVMAYASGMSETNAKALEGMEVQLASPRGFCAGVDRAIEIVDRALERYGPPVYVLHEIVHNRHVLEDFRARGVTFVETLDEVPHLYVGVDPLAGPAGTAETHQAEMARILQEEEDEETEAEGEDPPPEDAPLEVAEAESAPPPDAPEDAAEEANAEAEALEAEAAARMAELEARLAELGVDLDAPPPEAAPKDPRAMLEAMKAAGQDPTKVKSRIERAQWLRTLLVGIVTVVVGTFALTTDGMGYGTLLTGLFFGLGADLTAGSIETIRQNAKTAAG